ncbi:ParB N-terminal domain-containing protein [Streptomyces sp. BV286]|uniref:ParB N-terminal domain-containing protein n=1 Tax=Streptomyces sp. BV286 TaxID=2849672 RepID=UPI001C2E74D5|nr:ParB N-terminal domain-containing protein [Streptomyces sp. BV286]MBV1940787.1 ParB N-terminal domain-containing protein [Streptomyces sp. BV286]
MSGLAAPRYTTYIPLTDLPPDPANPKKHELERLIQSIKDHGFIDLPVVDERTGLVIAGHGRRKALIEMQIRGEGVPNGLLVDDDGGWLVPVTRGWSSTSDRQARAVLILLNRLSAAGGWDPGALAEILEDLATSDADLFDSLCISDDEMEELLRQVDPEGLPQGPDGTDAPERDRQLGDDFGDDGYSDSGDNERSGSLCCPACGHLFSPGR